ncbi:hypothetical protein I8920_03185 [Curtobacterium sp. YC1]|uniref:hypothetical protein n=1 Tax=Curtobacterium sp. YC1 TaxID=2795488 RepID=UPI0018E52598|nr:hypothetical protein [Curtobacterium sp. YC1]QQD76785.1 hypothetical protein I8920_03185 [Curtobacterium sp. YC1]
MSHLSTKGVTVGALALCALTLTGCSALNDQLHHEVSTHADTRADLQSPPAWMPADATDISSAAGTAAKKRSSAPTTVVFTSSDGVTADGCTTVPRKSAPSVTISGAPDAYAAETVLRCGDWSLTSEKDRWVAWTPNTGDDRS